MATVELKPNNNPEKYTDPKADKGVKLQKVVTGEVKTVKPSVGEKFKQIFLADSVENIGGYLVNQVIIPRVIDLLSDTLHSAIDATFGRGYGRPSSGVGSNERWNYNEYSSGTQSRTYSGGRAATNANGTTRYSGIQTPDYQRKYFTKRKDAELVIDLLNSTIQEYGAATIGDLYDLLGITDVSFTYQKYGWYDLGGAGVRCTANGYLIDLPRAVALTQNPNGR